LSNATDSYERVMSGFADLLGRLRNVDEDGDTARRIRLNTEARERAINRVWREYKEVGMEPPSELALSLTARRVMAEVDAERNRTLAVDQTRIEEVG
jgi:hypothetical protein